jgi:hypothetical protein
MESAQASFLPVIAEALEGDAGAEWQVQAGKGDDDPWISAQPGDDQLPEQGWKLHVSATAESSETVLRRCLAVLSADRAAFKVAGSSAAVEFLNEGQAGLSQIGKFITVYPDGDEQAVRLAGELDRATTGLPGPQVPSDRALRPGSIVHYRYGGFTERIAYTSVGEAVPTIQAGGGRWVKDSREVRYERPDWAEDPFEAAGIAESEPSRAIAGRYSPVRTLHRSPRGATYLAVDLEEVRTVVLKHAGRGARARPGMGDARDQLRWEAEVLRRVGPNPLFPEALDLVERGDDVFLVLERLEGMPLGPWVTRGASSGLIAPRRQIIEWGRELATAIAGLHDEGLVFRDLSPLNVIVGEDGRLRLIDFELAIPPGSEVSEAVGTLGYASPQQYAGEAPSVLDDVYSLGATLFLLATGTDPVFVEEKETFLERSLTDLNPEAGADLAAVIDRCRELDPGRRFAGAAEVADALAALPAERPAAVAAGGADEPVNRARYAELAAEIGDQLAAWVLRGEDGTGPVSLESLEARMELAGAILALIGLGPERISEGREAIAEGASRLAGTEPTGAAGLYLGEGGIALTLARAGRTLGDAEIGAAAAERTEHLRSITARGNDLFGGAAGGLRSELLIWNESEDAGALPPAVISAGDALLASAEDAGEGGLRWRSPPDPGESTGALHVGYAHGTAGIADVLLDLAEASGERRFTEAAAAGGRWVSAQSLPALRDGSGVAWPEQMAGEATPPLWCRGATGIGRFLLHLSEAGVLEGAGTGAERAATTVARGGRFLGPTSCHGLAGSAEFLLDVHAATGDDEWLGEADRLAGLLQGFRDEEGVWRSDSGEPLPFDLLTGIAGVAVCLLRLSDPDRQGALLEPRHGSGRKATPTTA